MTVLNTMGVCDALVAQIKAATLSFAPVLIQVGDLSHYPENPQTSADVPAVFVQPVSTSMAHGDIGGDLFEEEMGLRVLLVDSWREADGNLVRLKVQRTEELIEAATIRQSGDDFRLGGTVQGVVVWSALPVDIDFSPPEHAVVSQASSAGNARRIYATAFTVMVKAQGTR